ncbi:MAG: hypothetical protein ACKPH1_12655 [Microcystis panniformis]
MSDLDTENQRQRDAAVYLHLLNNLLGANYYGLGIVLLKLV